MYGISQRTPVNARQVAMIQRTTKATWMTAAMIAQKNTRIPPIAGMALKITWMIAETTLNKNQARPKTIDCIE